MKKVLLAGTFLAFMAVAAEAQIIIDYQRRTRNSTLTITYNSGFYGYFGYYGAYGGYGGFGDSFAYSSAGFGDSFYSGYGLYSYGTPPGLYGGRPYRSPYSMPPVADYTPMAPRGPGVSDRMNEYASSKEIEVGRIRFKMGDYKGAVDDFRSAVVADTSSAAAQAYFAVALAVMGDYKNADKALRAAADRAPFGKVDFSNLFVNEKELASVV